MIALREQDVHANPARLASAWADPASFLLVPEKMGSAEGWIGAALAKVPAEFARNHFVMLTSGSTGLPKLIIGRRDRAERLARVLHDVQQSEPVEQTIALLPLSYTYSFVNQWIWSHVMKRQFIATAGLADPGSLRNSLEQATNAMVCLVGVQVPLMLSHFRGVSFPGIIRVHFAGGRFPQERLGELHEIFPRAQVYNNYGCAEAMPRLTVRRANDAGEAANIGYPLPGVELRADEDHAIRFRSPYAAVGVVEGERFRQIQPEEWVPSGDLGRANADGSWTLLGRASEVFKRHGEKVSLAALMTSVSAVWPGQCAFFREPDHTGEEGCVLVLTPESTSADIGPVLMALRKHHPRAHWPLRIESVSTLPLLSNGKTDTRALSSMSTKRVLWKQHL
jgi:long-chain acyl-CoA synthetase